MEEHTIKKKEEGSSIKLSCTCGWQGEAIDKKYIKSVASRHILQKTQWPFDGDIKTKPGWTEAILNL